MECSVAKNALLVLKNKLEASTQEVKHLRDKNEELLRLQSDAQTEGIGAGNKRSGEKLMSSLVAGSPLSHPSPHRPIAQCVRQETPKQDCSTLQNQNLLSSRALLNKLVAPQQY